jgi:hypothetical protein
MRTTLARSLAVATALSICVVYAAAFAAPPSGRQPASRTRPDEITTLMVPATVPWVDTGITLGAGDAVRIRTWGRVKFGGTAASPPQGSGVAGGGCTFVVTDAGVAAHSVIGNVAPGVTFDGRGFSVGARWTGTVPISGTTAPVGRLLLGFNDAGVMCDRSGYDSWEFAGDNSGAFTAEVAVTRAR